MTRIINLNRERWLGLANAAMGAVADPNAMRRERLKSAAGRMVSATPPSNEPYAMSLCLAFRWSCTAYAAASEGMERQLAGDALRHMATLIRRLYGHVSPPTEVASMPVPRAATLFDPPEHPWMRRADIGRGA